MWLPCMADVRVFAGIGPIQVNVLSRQCQGTTRKMVLHGVCRSYGDLSLPDSRETYRLAPSVTTPASNKVCMVGL